MAYSAAFTGNWGLVMADELRVTPDLLGQVGNSLEHTGLSMLEVQQQCHRDADSAGAGWVGSSAHALAGLLDSWAAASTVQINRFGEHSCGMHCAAAEYSDLERRNTTAMTELRALGLKERGPTR